MARLAINATFIQNGYLPVMIPPVIRRQYLNFLEEARISNDSFFRFIAERQYETVTHFLRFIEPEKVELYFSIHDGSEKKDKPEHHSATGRNPKP
jgi:hypothetical protein